MSTALCEACIAMQHDYMAIVARLLTCLKHLQIDTAKKLRWYDREDLSQLISITIREKQQLHDTITAPRQVAELIIPIQSCLTP